MTNIEINIKQLKSEITNLPNDLRNFLEDIGLEVENLNEETLVLDITPNRPDLYSYYGIKRYLKSYIEEKTNIEYKINKSNYEVNVSKEVKEIRPFTVCAVIKNLEITENNLKEIIQLQEKLHQSFGRNRKRFAIGIYPIEKIKFPIEYTAKGKNDFKFKPLNSMYEMTGEEILESHPKGIEFKSLLENFEKYPLFIDANNEILSMPPVINSEKTGKVDENTTEIFLECSGSNKYVLNQTMNILLSSLSDMGGEIYEVKINYPNENEITPKLDVSSINVKIDEINKIIGINLTNDEIITSLKKMNLETEILEDNEIKVNYPCYRTDILHSRDIIEDVAIGYGYHNLPITEFQENKIGETNLMTSFGEKIVDLLIGLNFNEINTSFLLPRTEIEEVFPNKKIISILEGKTENNTIRNSLIPSLLKIFKINKHNDYPQRIFEIGKTANFSDNFFDKTKTTTQEDITEENNLAIGIAGDYTYTDIKQIIEYLFNNLEIKTEYEEKKIDYFIEGRCAIIKYKDEIIGELGELNPIVIEKKDLITPITIAEIKIEKLLELIKEKFESVF